MDKMKPGDIITVQTEAVRTAYDNNSFENIKIEVQDDIAGFNDLAGLFKKSIFKIEKNDSHKDIVEAGGTSSYYTIKGERIESLVDLDNGKGVKINGEYDIVFGTSRAHNLSKAYFLDDMAAQAIATELNKIELDRAKVIQKSIDKVVVMLGQMIDKKLV